MTRETCADLRAALEAREVERARLAPFEVDEATLPPLHLHVSSHGGSLFDALATYDYLHTLPALHTHVEGIVASAATLFTVVGAHRTMTRHSMMLVHQPSQPTAEGAWKAADLRDEWVNMELATAALLEVYNATTLLSIDDLTTLLHNEQMLTAAECLQYGFVDEILR